MGKNIHVVPYDDKWGVRKEGSDRVSSIHNTQSSAIKGAIPKAKDAKSDVVIHGRDGKIRDRDSYGHDPYPPKDKKH